MKNLILSLLFVLVSTSTLFVSAQTYPLLAIKSLDNTVSIQRTGHKTLTLKFENENGYIVTKKLTHTTNQAGHVSIWTSSDGYYIKLQPTAFAFASHDIEYYSSLDRLLWFTRVVER